MDVPVWRPWNGAERDNPSAAESTFRHVCDPCTGRKHNAALVQQNNRSIQHTANCHCSRATLDQCLRPRSPLLAEGQPCFP